MTVSIGLDRVGSNCFFSLIVGRVGLGQSANGLGWIGSHKMDPSISTPADVEPSALETTIFYCFMGFISALTYYLLLLITLAQL